MDQPHKTIAGAAATSGASGVMTKSNNTALFCTELMVTISTTIHVTLKQNLKPEFNRGGCGLICCQSKNIP